MKCPFCDKETELGYLQSSRSIMWSKNKLKDFIMPNKENGDFRVTKGIFQHTLPSHYCSHCQMLISFKEDEDDNEGDKKNKKETL